MKENKFSIVGEVEINVIDVETQKVIQTITEKNDITKAGSHLLSRGAFSGFPNSYPFNATNAVRDAGLAFNTNNSVGAGGYYSYGGNGTIAISDYRYVKPVFLERTLPNSVYPNSYISNWQNTEDPVAKTITRSVKFRFNPPTVDRTIWSVSIIDSNTVDGSNASSAGIVTLCPLNAPCTQSTTQILDITYRIVFNYTLAANQDYPGSMPISDLYPVTEVRKSTFVNETTQTPNAEFFSPVKVHKPKYQYRSWGARPTRSTSTAAYGATTFPQRSNAMSVIDNITQKTSGSVSFGLNDSIGHLLRSKSSSNWADVSLASWRTPTGDGRFGFFGKIPATGLSAAPVQPIHAHNSSSVLPFMDVNNPGNSAGTLAVNGQNWTKSETMPEYYRINCTNTGGAGTSKYYFSNRWLTGFDGNTYNSASYDLAFTERRTTTWQGYENTTLVGMHGSSYENPCDWEEYSDTKFVLFDDTGITISDIANGDAVTFDATTTPALPVTKVAQVAVKFSNKDVWVACSNTGLYRIQDAFGTPIVTKVSSINGTAVNACYAVSLGNNGSIICAYADGLAITSNDGGSWTTYNNTTGHKFEFNGGEDKTSTVFNGTTSEITLPISSSLALGSGDFTIEGWFYFNDGGASVTSTMFSSDYSTATTSDMLWGRQAGLSGRVGFYAFSLSGSPLVSDPTAPPQNAWVHYALSRNGGTLRMFRNGVPVSTYSSMGTALVTPTTLVRGQRIGSRNNVEFHNGKIYNFKITKGIGRYTTNFNPVAEYTPVLSPNVSLLTCVNSAIDDQSGANLSLTTVGTSTSASKVLAFLSGSETTLDNDWSKIKLIRADIQSTNNEMCVAFKWSETDLRYSSFWWSTAETSTPGLLLGSDAVLTNSTNLGTAKPFSKYWSIRCSHYGSMWVGGTRDTESYLSSTAYPRLNLHILKYRSEISNNLNAGDGTSNHSHWNLYQHRNVNISFYYDYYKNPYVAVVRNRPGTGSSSAYLIALHNSRGVVCGYSKFHPSHNFETINSISNKPSWYTQTSMCNGSLGLNASYHRSPLVHTANGGKLFDVDGWNLPVNGFMQVLTPFAGGTYSGGGATLTGFAADAYNGRYSPFEEIVWNKYLWNSNASAWQSGYHAPAIDSSQYVTNGIRHNFNPESHFFTGRSLIDVTNTFKLPASTGADATFAFTVNASAKLTSVLQETTRTLLSLDNSSNLFRVMWDGGVNFEIHHGTWASPVISTVTTTPANGTAHRVVVTVSGTSCVVYINGTQAGTATLAAPLALDAIDYAYIGASALNGSLTTKSAHPFAFFRGSLTNVQLWKAAWGSADVTSDYNNQSVVIGSIASSNLLAHLKLTEALVETKPTHSTAEGMTSGLTIAFNNSAIDPSTSFVSGDVYTFGVTDGILKDNAMTFTYGAYEYLRHNEVNGYYSIFRNATGTNTIQAPSTITAPIGVVQTYHWSTFWSNPGYYTKVGTANAAASGLTESGSTSHSWNDSRTITYQTATGDFTTSFKVNKLFTAAHGIGMTTWLVGTQGGQIPTNLVLTTTLTHTIQQSGSYIQNARFVFSSDYKVTVEEWHNGSLFRRLITPVAVNVGDKFDIKRVGSEVTYYINDVLVYTSPRTFNTGVMTCRADSDNIEATVSGTWAGTTNEAFPFGFFDMKLTHTEPQCLMYIGDPVTSTGCFSQRFLAIDVHPSVDQAVKLYLDGVAAPVTVINDYLSRIAVPAPGSLVLVPKIGVIVCNPADVGKTLSGGVISISMKE